MTTLLLVLALLVPQEATYLRCESPEDIRFYTNIRDDAQLTEMWVGWNQTCEWTGPQVPYVDVFGDTIPGALLDDFMETDDPAILRIWLWGEGPRYALREDVIL